MKAVSHVPATEVVAHRIFWSVPVAGLLLVVLRRTADLKAAFRSWRTLAMAAVTASLINRQLGYLYLGDRRRSGDRDRARLLHQSAGQRRPRRRAAR